MEGGNTSLEERVKRAEVRMRLLEAEGLPIVWARPLLISAMVASVQDKSAKGRSAPPPRRAGDCVRVSTGEDHPSFQTVSTFLSVVEQFDSAVGEGRRALEG